MEQQHTSKRSARTSLPIGLDSIEKALPPDSMECTQSSLAVGHEIKRQFPVLESVSQYTLLEVLKANIRMSEQGLGLIVIQNGPYLQIMSLVEKSSAANDGKLKPGDVLVKIGHANVFGWTLQQLGQLLHNIPIGTTLQIKVYRDFVEVPQHWQRAAELIPEVKLPVMTADTSEDGEEDEDDDDDDTESSSNAGDVETFQYSSAPPYCCELPLDGAVSDRGQALSTGPACDAELHRDNALHNPKSVDSG